MKPNGTQHDNLVIQVINELEERGHDNIKSLIDYNVEGHCGEIDIYAIKDNYVLLFEIKSHKTNSNYRKAKEQLERAETYCFKNKRVFSFFVYGDIHDEIQYKWIRRKE